ncbi:Flagellar hook protein FlgE [Magnetospira sp. QH-2]|nr:Flagellar hook protein FlgE [Magnetospira sp. QH-2]
MGMYSQAQTMSNIGTNIANVNTGGYKRTDTHFSTVLSERMQHEGDQGGIRPKEYNRISNQGNIVGTDRALDLAINGSGFFVLNTKADGSGDTFYGRDGSFHQESGELSSAVDNNGNTVQFKKGYLADKNGYFVQGWEADINGNFSPGGTLKPIRLDMFAYYDQPVSTTEANLHLNLPADAVPGENFRYSAAVFDSLGATQAVTYNFTKTDTENEWTVQGTYDTLPTAQVNSVSLSAGQTDTLTLTGTVEAGDTYTASINGNAVNYVVLPGDVTIDDVRTGLMNAINASGTVNTIVAATAGALPGQMVLNSVAAGATFTTTTSATNAGIATDEAIAVSSGSSIEAGDVYTVTIDGTAVSYTALGTETDMDGVRDGLVAAINAHATVSTKVTATPSTTTGEITLTAATAGTAFDATVSATNGGAIADNSITTAITTANLSATPTTTSKSTFVFDGQGKLSEIRTGAAQAQVNTLTLTGGVIEAGDTYTATIGTTDVTYTTLGTEADIDAVRDALMNAINADATAGATVVATAGANPGEIVLTANTPGTPFTIGFNAANGGATADNAIAGVNTTPNKVNLPSSNPATTLTNSFTWANGGTATTAFDFTDTTQFASDDLVQLYYDRNGNTGGQLSGITFDTFGVAVGSFSNGTSRALYKLPLAQFVNPDLLSIYDGNVYGINDNVLAPSLVSAELDGFATFTPNAKELSNVDIGDEFSKIIMTQNAYNSSATVFKTVDEMTVVAKDLIR